MTTMLLVLGAPDPEMAAIERLATAAGMQAAYAVGPDGQRVHPGNAYRAIGYTYPVDPKGVHHGPAWGSVTHLVECDTAEVGCLSDLVVRCDHHRSGDPGFGKPPEEFLSASSIGQVVANLALHGLLSALSPSPFAWERATTNLEDNGPEIGIIDYHSRLGWRVGVPQGDYTSARIVPADILFVAAADHCLEAAYRGRCPGINPDALMHWRVEQRAAFQGRPVEAVLADMDRARGCLLAANSLPCIEVHEGSGGCADLRGAFIPELPEAACREGIPFLATVTDRDGRVKTVLQAAPPELIRRFLAGEIVPGLVDMYGDPARGFAGGYVDARR